MARIRYQQDEVCGSCAYFHRHYGKRKDTYFPLNLGHCVYPRLKDRRDDERCPHWRPADGPGAEAP